jgi:hypothetical protein
MSVHQRLGADVIRHNYTQGLLAYQPSLQMEGTFAPGAWNGSSVFIAPLGLDAGRTNRQSHERRRCP